MRRHIILLLSFLFIFGCSQKRSCENLPSSFNSYKEAQEIIKNTKFNYIDEMNTSKSSWIRGASFYSCDLQTGYLIIETDKKEYIHQDIPIEVWNNFKKADSFGRYYSRNIRGKYKIKIENY